MVMIDREPAYYRGRPPFRPDIVVEDEADIEALSVDLSEPEEPLSLGMILGGRW